MTQGFELPAPPELVWPLVSDPAADYRSIGPPPKVVAHHPRGTPGLGSVYRVTTGTGASWEAEIVAWEPPTHLATRTTMGGKVVGQTSLRVVATPGGCRVEVDRPGGDRGSASIGVRLSALLFRRSTQRQADAYERAIRDRLLGALARPG
jgi:uncharacterized protein YndB with AHSA1/START domain